MKRDLISLQDLSGNEVKEILNLTSELKAQKSQILDVLKGRSVGLIFQKPSNRTRVSFEVGIHQLGGNCIYLGPKEIRLGQRESTADVAQTLNRYLDAIVARTFSHADVVELGQQSDIPIINGLSDLYHPCQAMADIFTVLEKFGTFEGLTLTYVGDGNNVCHSLLLACAMVGLSVNVATPKGFEPQEDIVQQAQKIADTTGCSIRITESVEEAVKDSHIIYCDVWVSMGQEEESADRLKIFQPYQVNAALLKQAASNHIFMHCLPAHRGQEVTAEVIDGDHSVVFDQAENRMHVQKAILAFLMQNQ